MLAAALVATGGCSSSAGKVSLSIRPRTSISAEPFRLGVDGVSKGETVRVRMTSTDAAGVTWSSSATYRAAGRTLDLGAAAPVSGSYRGVDAMGLFDTLAPSSPNAIGYAWSTSQIFRITVDDADGEVLGTGAFTRRLAPGVRSSAETVARDGFDGTMFTPLAGHATRTAVLVFGGSEAGNALAPLARALAAEGHPALSIAYFDAPGLPKHLVKIPLEYFANALRWLAHRPGVGHVDVVTSSRGTAAGELLGVHYPRLVHGLALGSPTDSTHAGLVGGLGAEGHFAHASSWMYEGKQVPYDTSYSTPPLNTAAAIDVGRIRAPMLLVCGDDDQVWGSCDSSKEIIRRVEAHGDRPRPALLDYPDAGHFVGLFLPYRPNTSQLTGRTAGLHPWTNGQALEKIWPALLRFLD